MFTVMQQTMFAYVMYTLREDTRSYDLYKESVPDCNGNLWNLLKKVKAWTNDQFAQNSV